jgi:hypothetical protein
MHSYALYIAPIVYKFFYTLPFIWNSLLLLINTIFYMLYSMMNSDKLPWQQYISKPFLKPA